MPFGAPGDACQDRNRQPGAPGADPCGQLEWHGGVWQFDARKTGQTEKDGRRYATGIRSLVAMTWNPHARDLYALQHGRDDLYRSWPQYFSRWQSAVLPSEEFFRVTEGFDGGWPYYYFDWMQGKKLLNPEYGGDGKKEGDGAKLRQAPHRLPGALRAQRPAVLRRHAVPGALPPRCVHRLPRLDDPHALLAGRLHRRLRADARRPAVRRMGSVR